MSFWDEYEDAPASSQRPPVAKAAERASSQNDTSGVCDYCGFAGDDVLIGVCADCAKEDA